MELDRQTFPERTGFLHTLFQSPEKLLFLWLAVYTAVWTLQASLTQTILPLDAIETIVWGEQMQWGHMKHPPLSGWVGYAFSWLSGYRDWGLYLAAQLCAFCGVWYTFLLAREFMDRYEAAAAALLVCVLFYYTPPAMKFCSHDLQIALLPAMVYYFCKGVREDRLRHWFLFGLASAAAFLAKYSAAQLFPACLLFLLLTPEGRRRFRSPGVWLSALTFLAVLLPHVQWLRTHDFYPVLHLRDRLENPTTLWESLLPAVGTVLMPYACQLGALFLLAFPWKSSLRQGKPVNREALRVSLVFTLIPVSFYLIPALLGKSIILGWFSYLASFTGITSAALFPWKIDERMFRRLFIAMSVYSLVMVGAVTADSLLRPVLRNHSDPHEIVKLAEDYVRSRGGTSVGTVYGDRWLAGVVQNYSPARPPSCPAEDVCAFELLREKMLREGVLLIMHKPDECRWLRDRLGVTAPVDLKKIPLTFRTLIGKSKTRSIALGWIPPVKSAAETK